MINFHNSKEPSFSLQTITAKEKFLALQQIDGFETRLITGFEALTMLERVETMAKRLALVRS